MAKSPSATEPPTVFPGDTRPWTCSTCLHDHVFAVAAVALAITAGSPRHQVTPAGQSLHTKQCKVVRSRHGSAHWSGVAMVHRHRTPQNFHHLRAGQPFKAGQVHIIFFSMEIGFRRGAVLTGAVQCCNVVSPGRTIL